MDGIPPIRLTLGVTAFCVCVLVCAGARAAVGIGGPPETPSPRIETPEWWQQRHEGFNARVKQGNVDLIFIGDSITQRWEQDGKDAWKRYYARRNAVNLGIDGDRTQQVLWRLDHGNIDGISPKLAVLLIGTNNILESPPKKIADAVKLIVERLRTKLPNTKVLLLGILPRTATRGDRESDVRSAIAATNKWLAALANNRIVYFTDIGAKFLTADGKLAKEALTADAVHLSAKGYETWAEAIEPMVAKLMEESDIQR
jgi:lysophospholipase L1-like esterase